MASAEIVDGDTATKILDAGDEAARIVDALDGGGLGDLDGEAAGGIRIGAQQRGQA